MNRNRYRTIFSKRLGTLVPVAESCKANGKGAGTSAERGFDAAQPADASNVPGRLKTGTAWILAGAALWSGAAWAGPLPTGGVVTGGTGTISQNGTTLTVNQSSQSLTANWQSFSIGAGNTVVFNQPNGASVALNRIVGNDASAIYGNLQANGQVFLVNPNGILFAPGSQVSAGGLAASTLAISDADAAAGRYRFTHGTGAGSVVNEGRIDAGSVVFAGSRIVNNGTISTPGGRTTFAAGDQVTVSLLGGLLTAQVDAAAAGAEIANHGQILANGGRVDLLAGRADSVLASLINTDGVVQARGVREDGGRIFLDGGAGGTVHVGGTLDAAAPAAGRGGDVHVLGDRVTLGASARIDASGPDAGGTVLVGGDYQGKNPAILNSHSTTVEQGATIHADGAAQGGRVIVWSDDATTFAGDVRATGKGFAEVSGKGTLGFSGNVNTGGGTLLLDPAAITIQAAAGDGVNTIGVGQLATMLAANDVVLDASGNITWNNGITTLDYNGVGTRTLTLQAGTDITIKAVIKDSVAGGDKLNLVLNADRNADGIGAINLATGINISTSGGDIVLRGGNAPLTALPAFTDPGYAAALSATAAHGISIGLGTVDAGGGNITMRGEGKDTNFPAGILLNNNKVRTSGAGTITLDGLGYSASTGGGYGVWLHSTSPLVSTVDGTVSIQGTGRGTGTGNAGVFVDGGAVQATGNGDVIVNGLGGAGADTNDGVLVNTGQVSVFNGSMTVSGTGRGTGIGNDGIEVSGGAVVAATGSGNVSLAGASTATGATNNRGIVVSAAAVRSAGGTLTLQGSSVNPAAGAALSLESAGTLGGAGQAGAVTLTGDSINLASGQVGGTGALLLQPLTPSTSIGLGDGAGGVFNLASSALGTIQDGFSSITVGRADGSGAVDVRTAGFTDPVTIRTPAAGGSIAVNGTLSTGTGTSLGSITLQAGGTVALNNGTIATDDALALTGGAYDVTGSSTLNSNTLAFGNTNGIGNAGTLTLNQAIDTTIGNAIGGVGSLVKAGTNTLVLTGTNSYGGTTMINAGTLQVGAGGSTGTLGTGAVTNNGTLVLDRSDALNVANPIGGTGNLLQTGTGTTTLGGINTYSGSTTVTGGALRIGADNNLGTGGTLTLDGGTLETTASFALNRGITLGTGGGTLDVDGGTTLTAAGVIAGTGALTKADTGTLILTGTNTYGGTTTINAGTLQVGAGGTSGTLGTGAVTNNGSLVFDRSDNVTIANAIGGTGNVAQSGTGTTVFTGTNSYAGTTTINAGTLQVGAGGTSGTLGTGAVTNNGALVFNRSDNVTVAAPIGGTGNVAQSGAGTTILAGANTYGGTTTINAGTLQVGAGGTNGTLGTGAVTNNGALVFDRSDALNVANPIGGTGNLLQTGAGTTTLGGINTYSGSTTVTGGALRIGADNNLGTGGTLTLDGGTLETTASFALNRGITLGTGGGTLDVDGGTTLTAAGVIAGTGALTKADTGTLILTGTNTYGGTTTINAGTLQVGAGGTSGTLGTGAVTNNSALVFDRSDNVTVAAPIGGTGNVAQSGTGTTVFAGTNSYGGTTTINAGTLQVGAGGTNGTLGTGAVTNNGALVFDRSDALNVANPIGGTGNLLQTGAGTTTLGGINTYSGSTTVTGGALRIGADNNLGTGGTLTLDGGTLETTASFALNRGITLGTGGGTLDVDGGTTLTAAGVIAGTGALTKADTGTLILTGTNTYGGTTTINAGTLQVGAGGTSGTLGTGAVTNNGSLVFDRSDNVTIANAIGGIGDLTQAGTGTVTLTADNTYGGATTVNAGTLQAGNGGGTGMIGTGAITNNGTLVFNRSDTVTVTNDIAGTGNVTQSGAGTAIFTGTNTYGGTTTINAGTLQVGAGGTSGTLGTGAVTNNGALVFNRSDNVTVAAPIGGTGNVAQSGAGTTILAGANTYGGTTTINAGTLQVGAGGTNGTLGTGAVTNNGALVFDRSDALNVANPIGGTGNLLQTGAGTTTLGGINTYSGSTTVTGGALRIGADNNLGTGGTLTLDGGTLETTASFALNRGITLGTGGGTLDVDGGTTLTAAGVIAGTGALTKADTGTLILTGTNTYGGTTTINAGTLQVGAGGTSGTLGTGAVTNNGSLVFDRSDNVTIANAIGGTGNVAQSGTGTTVFTGTNSYAGTTTINAGTLQVGAGGTSGTLGTGAVTNNGSLVFNRSDSVTVAAPIGGTGNVAQSGTGTTILAGTNSYAGTTTINAGTLQVGAGGTNGTLGAGAVTNNGTLVFNHSDALNVANPIGGTGNLLQTGTGTTTLGGINTYSGSTTVTGGALRIGADNNLGTGGTLTLDGGTLETTASFALNRGITLGTGGGTLDVDGGTTLTAAGVIAGTGALTKADTGTLILTGTNTYGGTTTINAGTLQVGAGGTSGTLGTGAVTNNSALVFDRSDNVTVAAPIGGTGNVAQSGTGTTILAGTNSYAGTTTINAGTLQVGAGGSTGTLGTGAVTNNGALVFDRSDALNVANPIGGTGNLLQTGAGTTTLGGINTYSGSTTVTGGALRIGADNNLGTGGTLTLDGGTLETTASFALNRGITLGTGGGTLDVDGGTTLTAAGVIAGTGALTKADTGTLILTGTNTYGGTTTINAGTLQVGAGGTSGTLGTGVVTNNGSLVFDRSDSVTIANAIGGTGNVAQSGTGTTVFTGTNSYAGTTTINAGTLQVGAGGTSGTLGTGAVTNNGALVFNRSDNVTVAAPIGGTGNVAQSGAGTTILAGANTYGGTTTINAGTLQVGAGGTNGTLGAGAVSNNGALVFNRSDNLTVGAAVGGTGSLTQAGTGTVILAADNTYVGTTTVRAGTLQVGAGGTKGTLGTGAVTNNGALVFDRADALQVANTIGGTGNLAQVGTGTTTLAGANTYSGPTSVTGGVLRIGADNNLGTGGQLALDGGTVETTASFTLDRGIALGAAGGALAVDGGTTLTHGGVIAGAGALTKAGAGTLTLTGNNTYAGTTTVSGGKLQVGNKGTTGTLGAGTVTDNGDVVFDRADATSLASLAAGGITGTGNVSVLAGGNLNIDRAITLTGANSTILLAAGRDQPAGTAAGGDVTLTSNIGTSATGTVTIFSGNATTAAYEAKISGATGPTRYKTYNASAADTGGAVAGTRNYAYRQGSGTLSVGGLAATKAYDGLVDATVALNASNAAVAASGDGDLLAYRDLTQVNATFDSAHAGSRTITATFQAPSDIHYSADGANWSVARFSGGTVTGTGSGTITPRQLTAHIDGKGKTYDGQTGTMSTLGAPSGFVGGDSANGVGGILLAFDNPNAGTRNIVASGTGSLIDFKGKASGNGSGVGAHNEVAGLAGDYTVATPQPVSAVIAPAALTIRANDDAKLLTQSDSPGYNGVRFDGFVNGESATNLDGALGITRSNADTNTAGNYTGVLVPGGYTSSNYAITYANGDFRILPAQQLLVRVQNVQNNYGTPASYVVTSAQYLDADGATLRTLTQTAHDGNTYTYLDGMGGGIAFTVTPQGTIRSGAGQLAVGNYALAGTGATVTGNNFTGTHFVGVQTVNRVRLTPQANGVSKVYDGTTAAAGISVGLDGLLAGDAVGVDASGAFSSRNAGTNRGYWINGIALHGADAGNYYLAPPSLTGNNGTITPRPVTVTAVPGTKVYDGTRDASGKPVVTGSLVAGDSFTSLSQAYTSSNIGTNLTLMPQAQIDDGNGGANYVLALAADTTGVIRAGVDIGEVGVTHAEATLNRDHGERQPAVPQCAQGVHRDACAAGGDGVYRIVAGGLKLPAGLVLSP